MGRQLAMGALALWLAACALRISPQPIEPHLAGGIPEGVLATRARLGISDFEDRRSELSRETIRPPLRLRWYGLTRYGENQTGDSSFLADAAEGVRRDAAATLMRSGAFREVRRVDGWSEEIDLLLEATLEEFVGLQLQRSELNLSRVGWLRSRLGSPLGIVRVHYRVSDRAGLRWEERIETRLRVPDAEIAEAVLHAMAVTNERMAHALHRSLVERSDGDLRRLKVQALDACGLGQKRVQRLFQDVSEIFEREADVALAAQVQTWTPAAPRGDLHALLAQVESIPTSADGVLIALVPLQAGREFQLLSERYGLASQLGAHAVVTCQPGGAILPVTLTHEIGHLFGAVHVRDPSSPMHALAEFDGRFFDPLNRRILRLTRQRLFGHPLSAAVGRRLQTVYRAAARFPDDVDAADLRSALAVLPDPSSLRRGRTSP